MTAAGSAWRHRSVSPFVDGAHATASDGPAFEVINPSNGRRLFSISAGADSDVNRAVESARRAFEDGRWSGAPPSFRKKVLHRFAGLIESDSAELDALDAEEMGKPISISFSNALSAAGMMRFYAEAVDKVMGDVFTSDKTSLVAQRRVPRGVVAAIVPWNFPTAAAVMKIAPALAAGNCVVLKPSELSSRSAIHLARLGFEAGLPTGVLNVVPGLGTTVGRALGLHMDVNMVAFTGSTEVGKLMLQYAGQSNMKWVMAECGGKSPQIVFDDGVDLDAASSWIARVLLINQGQLCSVGSRLLVQRSIEKEMVSKIAERLKEIVVGDARDPKTTFGPLASSRQRERVKRYVEAARADGARLVAGGKSALTESDGYFFEPTLFSNVSPNARIAQEEVFGPVLSAIAFENEAEAIKIANGTKYGLAAYVWTASLSTGMRMAKSIRSQVWINAATPSEGPGYAWSSEPSAESGVGGAEGGLAGMESYLQRQLVWFSHN